MGEVSFDICVDNLYVLLFSLHFEIKKLLQKLESHDHIHRGYDGDDVSNSILSMSTESTQILSEQVHILFVHTKSLRFFSRVLS